ncbi:MAG: NAD(P)/FAD-dependent oxidoreductase, partial [Arthrobacter sp.]
SAEWDSETGLWTAVTQVRGGTEQRRTFNAVITATGQLDIPNIPDFPGRDSFGGVAMHSQDWDEAVDYRGKRVAVIGTGASAYQIVPAVCADVESMVVFQRSAPWMLPAPSYHDSMTEVFSWLSRKVPHYAQWYRLWVTVLGIPGRFHTVRAEEGWQGAPLSVSARNQEVREELTRILGEQFSGHPEMLKHAVPGYPPGAKRMLRDNGVWARALTSEHVTLETSPIREITPTGIVTEDGTSHDVDIIVYATGFRPSEYLEGIQIRGVDGVEIHDAWDGDARAYNGITVPGFPNFFMVYGPNVGGVVAGSLHFMLERASEYALKAVREVLERRVKALDVRPEALERFVAWVDGENRQMAWGQPYVRTWYQNSKGRVSQIWPFTNVEYWEVTESINPADYDFLA